jgi:hypothetical protein
MPSQPYFITQAGDGSSARGRRWCYQGGVPTYRRPFAMPLHSGFVSTNRVHKRGPAEWPGPSRGNEPVLTPMYASMSWRPPPSRPFLNLLCSLCTFLRAASCERFWTVHRWCRRIVYHPNPAPSTPTPLPPLPHFFPAHYAHQSPDWFSGLRTSAPDSASPPDSRTPECRRSPSWPGDPTPPPTPAEHLNGLGSPDDSG